MRLALAIQLLYRIFYLRMLISLSKQKTNFKLDWIGAGFRDKFLKM